MYALGALLYRLLTARTPFGDGTPDAREAIRQTLVEPPAPASSAVADPLLARRLRGDLDAIVAKALAKEPEERYPSAVELAADVTRHLDDLPVLARPSTRAVRLRKLIRRHRLGAAMVVLATTLAVSILIVGVARLREAERERERAESVTAFLTEVLEVGDPADGGGYTLAADDLLHRALERAEARLDGRPALQAAVFHQVGELLLKLGHYEDAREALTRAITLRRELAPRGSHDLAASLARYGYTFQYSPRAIQGLPALREAVRISRWLYGERDPRVADALLELAVYISRLIPSEYHSDRLGREAADSYEQALDLYRRAHGEAHPKIPETLHNMAFSRQDPAQRIDLLEQAVRGHEALDPGSPELAYALSDLGLVYEGERRTEAASIALDRSLEILRAREDDDLRVELTIANNLAGVLRDRGRYAEAVPLYREVLRDRERVVPGNDRTRAFTLYGLGRSLLGLGEASEAEPHLRAAATILEEEGAEFLAAVALGWVAEALHVQGRAREAEALARASYRALLISAGEGHQETVTGRERLERLTTASSGLPSAGSASNLREDG